MITELPPLAAMSDADLRDTMRAVRERLDAEALRRGPLELACRLDPLMVSRAHLRMISAALVRLRRGEITRLAISTPPQVGKSQTVRWFLFWVLAQDPRLRLLLASYSHSLAVTHGRAVRSMVDSFGDRFDLAVSHGSRSVHDWQTTQGGGLRAAGVGGGLTGRSGDLVVVDDPLKDRAAAESAPIRENLHDWWSSVLLTRLAPAAPVVVIHTRWHPDDLIGRLIKTEPEAWETVRLPAFADSADDPMGRALGDPLSHPLIAEGDTDGEAAHWAERRDRVMLRDWEALFQQNPKPSKGVLVTEDLMRARRFTGRLPVFEAVAVGVDPSGGRGRDTTGLVVAGRSAQGRVFWLEDATSEEGAAAWSREAVLLAARWRASVIVVEANYGGDMAGTLIAQAWDALAREGRLPAGMRKPYVRETWARTGKRLRAEGPAQALGEGRIWLAADMPELIDEWVSWREGSTSPGRIDASTVVSLFLLPSVSGPRVVEDQDQDDEEHQDQADGDGGREGGDPFEDGDFDPLA
ncbi:terminase large subunit domain-containing protein [Streptomyces sp. NPDC015492]|uniref:terminase large subunit domain-containing protein n=1 Tax=Streptomyces sp. NPDC015492 TaxID=3364958 RepID=UPI0036FBAC3B